MSGNELIQFVTKELTSYVTMPKEKRKKQQQERKQNKMLHRRDWFGNVPFYLTSMIKQRRR